MTEEEVYSVLKNNTDVQDHGEHECDNSWLGCGIKDITEGVTKGNYTLLGWFPLAQAKNYTTGIDLDIGVVCEDEDGNRFWCHYAKKWLDDDLDFYEETHNLK